MKTLNIAHRGFSGMYPENTMLAFKEAINAHCDGIETDVQVSKDGVLVICHDELLDRTSTGTGLLKNYTYEELLNFDFGIKFSPNFIGEKIPTLEDLLKLAKKNNIFLNLELKNGLFPYEGIEKKVIDLIYKYDLKDSIILSSFNHFSMMKCKEIDSSIKTGLLYEGTFVDIEEYCKKLGADALHPQYFSLLDPQLTKRIQDKGIMINTYTVNHEIHMNALLDLKINSIITNYPDKLYTVMNNR
ncbi:MULTISPECIES: glycerophosphodiester phosphodiesterase [Clostridium]|uniref:Glycerophosphoryl diester phosphodiesterase n=1 Tax=Clostridium cadaveris TaxID=1529 RepID=A0A1I2LDH4_9CLOT|nr:glycerophosphodiester phosphodiesterase [Clostridium cadaveris]MDU4951703.1 glycerophosphodiester phosphodiesterase [Clostridium sp.]MDM8311320.1 glycerophosphodiester phosphodiesterase [Clostridium cadaveris]NME64716.1 glycerophosphodiester phosphodiesterase [Clostridium cadaveris]UFH64412.1 glycerophosphodiester phosphodiesterase [Clostridium cadaveris]SFF75231.1 glycerophosphoryl diester phosphodiesterase [Clostridium cadaveris]